MRPPGPLSGDYGDERIGARGPCEFGYIAYNIVNENNGMREAYDLSGFLEDTGEIWFSFGDISHNNNKGNEIIDYSELLENWKWGMINAMQCLDALGASKNRRVIIGIERLKDLFWNHGEQFVNSPARKSEMIHDKTEYEWSIQDQKDFITSAWNKLLNVFSLSPSDESSNLEYWLSNFDKQYSDLI